jgi:hypothetical protein
VERRSINVTEEDIGLHLVEAKSILKEIPRVQLQDQVEEIGELARVCRPAARIYRSTTVVIDVSTLCSGGSLSTCCASGCACAA